MSASLQDRNRLEKLTCHHRYTLELVIYAVDYDLGSIGVLNSGDREEHVSASLQDEAGETTCHHHYALESSIYAVDNLIMT